MHASSVVDEVDAEEFNLDTDFVRSFVSVNRPVLIKGLPCMIHKQRKSYEYIYTVLIMVM